MLGFIIYRYHHMSVLIYAWTTFYSNDPTHRWYLIMNASVHAIMYTYYAFRVREQSVMQPYSF